MHFFLLLVSALAFIFQAMVDIMKKNTYLPEMSSLFDAHMSESSLGISPSGNLNLCFCIQCFRMQLQWSYLFNAKQCNSTNVF